MLFNSFQFLMFFVIVYSLYLVLDHKWQNRMLLVASYIFYGSWDWRFLFLIAISTIVDYYCAIKIDATDGARKKRLFLIFSIVVNLSFLCFFKYFNFFTKNMLILLNTFGISADPRFLNIILPVGISFYTFQAMSYTIDVYRGHLKPAKKLSDFALFVSFFPQLVAGPIERASHLLPQVLSKRKVILDEFYEGCYMIFWGLFLKVFVADNLARLVDPIFAAKPPYNGLEVLLGVYAFAFQIFGDFAGYSHIARGLGKCMGFDIMINFNLPYFATNPSEFWHRWHISLSSWLRDYLYIPLGGNRRGALLTYRNLAITMILGGLWHGASWTFVIWGAYHGVLLIIHRLIKPWLATIPSPRNAFLSNAWFILKVVFFFQLVSLGWLIFRAQSFGQVAEMLKAVLFNFIPAENLDIWYVASRAALIFAVLLTIQIIQFRNNDLMAIYKKGVLFRAAFYVIVYYMMIIYGTNWGKEFIYFQF